MKSLKKVVCVTRRPLLTYNKIYDVLLYAPSVKQYEFRYFIHCDDNVNYWLDTNFFKDLSEIRNEKLEKLGI